MHFQTPEANVVSEATDPLQDDRNNSSQAGSTPFQKARPPRRVSFAAPDVVAIPDKHITAGSSVRSHEQAGLSSTWQDRNTVGDVHADYKSRHYAASTDEGSTLGSQHTMHNPAAVSKPVTLSIELFAAPGSTPYLKGSQLSAALRSAIRAEDQTALPDTDKHSLQTDLSFRMSQLLQPDLHQHALPDQQVHS